jgi:hypothetical protein
VLKPDGTLPVDIKMTAQVSPKCSPEDMQKLLQYVSLTLHVGGVHVGTVKLSEIPCNPRWP